MGTSIGTLRGGTSTSVLANRPPVSMNQGGPSAFSAVLRGGNGASGLTATEGGAPRIGIGDLPGPGGPQSSSQHAAANQTVAGNRG